MNDFSESRYAFRGPFDTQGVRLSTSTRQAPLAELPAPIQEEIPISQLPLAGPLFGDEVVALVQNGITSRATVSTVAAQGETPVMINRTLSLVYPGLAGQTVFWLSDPDHYGRTYALTTPNVLMVTVAGVRYVQDDGTGTFGQYTINVAANTVTLLPAFAVQNDGDLVVFDVFNINIQTVSLAASIWTQALEVTAVNAFTGLAFPPDGEMTILYVNGRAFSDDSEPPSFTVTGQTIFWNDPLFSVSPGDQVVATYTYDGPASGGGGGGGGGIPEPPPDGKVYGRASGSWHQPDHDDITDWNASVPQPSAVLPLTDGTAAIGTGTTWARNDHVHPSDPTIPVGSTTPPAMDNVAVVGVSPTWARADHAHPSDATIPAASTTPPAMDAAAVIGTSLTYARADHVHPLDTTRAPAVAGGYLALSGGTLAGPVLAAADPAVALGLATKQYADAGRLGDNVVINGNFAINQRAKVSGVALGAAAYGHDRWKAGASGCTYTFTTALPDTSITISAGTLTQVIEAGMIEGGVYILSWTGTAQARVYQGSPTGSYAVSPVITSSLTAGVNTIVEFSVGSLTRVKFERGTLVTPFNRQSLAKTMDDCQRYYQSFFGVVFGSNPPAGGAIAQTFSFPFMRIVPAVTFANVLYTNASGIAGNTVTQSTVYGAASVTASGMANVTATWILNAEL